MNCIIVTVACVKYEFSIVLVKVVIKRFWFETKEEESPFTFHLMLHKMSTNKQSVSKKKEKEE